LWWTRIADILAFISGLSVVFELLGAHPLKVFGEKLVERARRARLMRKYAPIYARQIGSYNHLAIWLEIDVKESLTQPGPPLTWSTYRNNDFVARDEYKKLALDAYQWVTEHKCDESGGKMCVHAYETIRDRAWNYIGESGTPEERESWEVNSDSFTDLLSLLIAAACWLLIPTGIILGIIEAVRLLAVPWLATLASLIIIAAFFWTLARRRSRIPLITLAKLGNINGKPSPWNWPFRSMFHWIGDRYYTLPGKVNHSATWRMSAIVSQYALASALISLTRPAGFILNRPAPDHLIRWFLLAVFIISFLPILIAQ
jgi:hypothetical protein